MTTMQDDKDGDKLPGARERMTERRNKEGRKGVL